MKKRIKAIICSAISLIFGGIGIQKFYLGQTKRGILHVLFFWTGIPYLSCVIDLLRFIFMSENDFNLKYNSKYLENINYNNNYYDEEIKHKNKFDDAIDAEYSYVDKNESENNKNSNENAIIQKALEYHQLISNACNNIYDYDFSSKVKHLNSIFKCIIDKVKDDDKNDNSIKKLDKMLDYNIPTTLKLINSYADLSSSNILNSNNIKYEIIESIEAVIKYLNNILENIQKDDIMDITSDIDVLKANLKKDGYV